MTTWLPLLQAPSTSGEALLSVMTQAPFFVGIVWLFLKLSHSAERVLVGISDRHQKAMSDMYDRHQKTVTEMAERNQTMAETLSQRHNDTLKHMTDKFEAMDARRDSNNYGVMSALLVLLTEEKLRPNEADLFNRLRQDVLNRERRPRERSSTYEPRMGEAG